MSGGLPLLFNFLTAAVLSLAAMSRRVIGPLSRKMTALALSAGQRGSTGGVRIRRGQLPRKRDHPLGRLPLPRRCARSHVRPLSSCYGSLRDSSVLRRPPPAASAFTGGRLEQRIGLLSPPNADDPRVLVELIFFQIRGRRSDPSRAPR